MKTRLTVLLLLVLFSFTKSIGQIIQVLEENSGEPLIGTALFNEDKSKNGITDFDGFVDISEFSSDENITFQHISHVKMTISKNEILNSSGIVYLAVDTSTLDEVVLSISKFRLQKKDQPQKIVSISSTDIQFENPQTSADLLENSGQVYMQKSQLGGGSPLIRGFSTNRLLITIDGVRFNTAIFRGGNVQNVISIDPFSIESTEVILGPGSVIYGSDAVGGVLNFYTKNPKFSFKKGIDFSGNAVVRHSTANEEQTAHLDVNIGAKEWAFLSSVSLSKFGDLKMGKYGPDDYLRNEYVDVVNGEDVIVANPDPRVQKPTGYRQMNLMQKIRYMPSEHWDFDLGLFFTTTNDYARYDRLIQKRGGQLRAAEWYYGPQEWTAANLKVRNADSDSWLFDENLITLSYQRFKESRNNRDFGKTILFETDETVDAYSAAWDFEKKFGNNNLYFYGLEYVNNKVGSQGKQTDITTNISTPDASRYPDGATWISMAAYSSLQLKFSEKLTFQGGLRYNHIFIDAKFDNTFFDFPFSEAKISTGALTGSAGLSYQPNTVLGLKTNFSTAFRAPNIDDIGKIFDSEPGSVVVPNPDLKHEYAYNWEVGTTLNFGGVVKIDATTYYTLLHDALVRRDFNLNGETEIEYQGELSNVQAIQNGGMAEIYGFEAGIEVNFSNALQLTSQYNITDGLQEEDDGSKVPVRHAAPQFGNTHLIFSKKFWKIDAYAVYNAEMDFEDLDPSQQNNAYLYAKDSNGNPYSPSWYTLNLRSQFTLINALTLTATLENITNQRYRPYSSGITAPGTNLIVSASYKF